MPGDIIVPRAGVSPSYGLVILFNFACAGHLEALALRPDNKNPQQIPIGCFDAQHNQLGPSDFVFGLTRVYAYETTDEMNPVITQVDLGGEPARDRRRDDHAPFTVPICAQSDCPHHPIGPVVPPSTPGSKQVWADFYSTTGTFTSGARLLYDPAAMLAIPSGTNNNYVSADRPPGAPAQNFIWIVGARRSGRRRLGDGASRRCTKRRVHGPARRRGRTGRERLDRFDRRPAPTREPRRPRGAAARCARTRTSDSR